MKRMIMALIILILVAGCAKNGIVEEKNDADTNVKSQEDEIVPKENIILNDITANTSENIAKTAEEKAEEILNKTNEEQKKAVLSEWKKQGKIQKTGVSVSVLKEGDEYWMYYNDKDIMLAKSKDGIKFGESIQILKPDKDGIMVTNPAVVKLKNGKYRMLYEHSIIEWGHQANRVFYSAISNDGERWEVENEVFSDDGDGKPGEKFTSVPDIEILEDGTWRLYYCRGLSSAIAESKDEGLSWKKIKNIDLSVYVLDPDIIMLEDGTYKLFFSESKDEELREQTIRSASSIDGLNFELDEFEMKPDAGYTNLVDPHVIKVGNEYLMYYSQAKEPDMMFEIMYAVSEE